MRGDSYQLQGQQGAIVINDTTAHTGPFRWVLVSQAAAFDAATVSNVQGLSNIGSVPSGFGIGGIFSSIKLTSGSVVAYFA